MRKFLASVLMLVMLTPSLVCAMPVCIDAPQAVKAEKPCEGHGKHEADEGKTKQINLMQDCTGVDFQAVSSPSIEKPDVIKFTLDMSADWPVHHQWMNATNGSRGPPPSFAIISETYPPVFLTTQRIRI